VAAFVVSLAVYIPSLASGVATGDTAEYQTVPYILGITHPTGIPAYVLSGWFFSHAFAAGTVVWRLNAFAALCSALTASGVALLALALEANPLAAFAAAATFALGSSVWHNAVVASPHALAGLFIVGALLGSVAFARHGRVWMLLAACACAGLGLATHPETIWVLPALPVAAAWQRQAVSWRVLIFGTALVFAPLVLYAYLPIRSAIVETQGLDPAAGPPLNGFGGGIDWNFNDPRTKNGFLDEVLGRHEHAGGAVGRTFDPRLFPRAAVLWLQQSRDEFVPVFLVFVALGIIALGMRDRRSLSILFAGTAGGIVFAFSYRLDSMLPRYFLPSFAAAAALSAAASRLELPRVRPAHVAAIVSCALILIAGSTWWNNRGLVAELRYSDGQATIDAVRNEIPDGAIIIAGWYDALRLGYGAAVEHELGTRIIVTGFPIDYLDRLPDLARSRRIFVYANWGYASSVSAIPPNWVHERPSSQTLVHIYEIIPSGVGAN